MKEILRLNDYPDKFVRYVCRALENKDSEELYLFLSLSLSLSHSYPAI